MSQVIDNRGITLVPGQIVAYNLSGQIAMGTIKSIKPTRTYNSKLKIEIELMHSAAGLPAGKTSVVTNSRNVLVLTDELDGDRINACPNCGQTL